jgi:hypothetical protein
MNKVMTTFVLLILSFQASAQRFTSDAWHNLSPQFQPDRSLDVVNDGMNNTVILDKTADVAGQLWQITPIPGEAGFFRLSPKFQPDKSLDVLNDGTNNTVVLDRTADVTGQFWQITPIPGEAGFFRLSPQFHPGRSLDVVNDGTYDTVTLEQTANVTGQFWRITSYEGKQEARDAPVSSNGLERVFRITPPPHSDDDSESALQQLKAIFGTGKKVSRMAPSGDPYESDTWEFDDFVIWFDNAQESGITLASKAGGHAVGTPLGIVLNDSSLEQCKEVFEGVIEESSSNTDAPDLEVWKTSRDGIWYFLYFNEDEVLMRIKISSVDLDRVS